MAGTTIIDGTKNEYIVMKDYDKYNAAVLVFSNGNSVNCASGDLKARMDMLNGNGCYASFYQNSEYGIPYYQSTLNAFAQEFAELMNTLNGCTADDTSRAMFGTDDDIYDDDGNCIDRAIVTAKNIRISEEWMNNATMIGENYNEETGLWELTLDGTNVNKLYLGLDNEISIGRANEFRGSIYDYCLFVDNRLSESISYYKDQYDLNGQNASSLLDLRASVSGVSETEEGVNMMNYQKWFNANSRMLTAMDECIDRLISSTGIAGR